MKVICDCGAKYGFDATPEMVRNPLTFACPTCGVDLSPRILAMVQEQFGAPHAGAAGLAPDLEIAPPPPSASAPPDVPVTPPPPQHRPTAPRIKVNLTPAPSAAPPSSEVVPPLPPPVPAGPPVVRLSHGAGHAEAAPPDVTDARFCVKHPQVRVTEQCRVCGKPICPKCMELFGYVCSPRCKEKAELQGIAVPRFAGQRDAVERAKWNKMGLVVKLAALLLLTVVGVWFWYAWFGSRPHTAFKVRFEDAPAMSGTSAFCPNHQIVFIHGDKLARYDLKTKQEVWLRHLLDKKQIQAEAERDLKEMQEAAAKSESEFPFKIPRLDELVKELTRSAEERLQLRVQEDKVWVADGEKVRRYDWATGEPKQEVEFSGNFADGVLHGTTLEFKMPVDTARLSVTKFDLASGTLTTDEIGAPARAMAEKTNNRAALLAALAGKANVNPPGTVRGMTPHQLAAAVANAPLAGKLAAPATISVARNQQQALDAMAEMDAGNNGRSGRAGMNGADEDKYLFREQSRLIPTAKGFVELTSQMTEKNIVMRSAMKAAPKKSALDGPVNAAATMDIANELLNEMARNAGADQVREDQSKYRVKLHLGGGAAVADWEGEVVGEPAVYPQATVNVVAAGKKIYVLDQQNQLKWESTLNFAIAGAGGYAEADKAESQGLGPVVERGDTLYVYDEGVLSAFETATGKARWRLPSVGITGMFFDAAGKIYLNTTTASPDKIKYSRQINVNEATGDVVLKLDPVSGKELWKYSMGGTIAYLSGKFMYTVSYQPPRDEGEEQDENLAALGLDSNPYIRLRRINPSNGRVMWDYFDQRGALDVQIHDNVFQIVLKKEVQVLKFLSF